MKSKLQSDQKRAFEMFASFVFNINRQTMSFSIVCHFERFGKFNFIFVHRNKAVL